MPVVRFRGGHSLRHDVDALSAGLEVQIYRYFDWLADGRTQGSGQ